MLSFSFVVRASRAGAEAGLEREDAQEQPRGKRGVLPGQNIFNVTSTTKTLCPSGLRGWTQIPLARAAWAQIPQVSSQKYTLALALALVSSVVRDCLEGGIRCLTALTGFMLEPWRIGGAPRVHSVVLDVDDAPGQHAQCHITSCTTFEHVQVRLG